MPPLHQCPLGHKENLSWEELQERLLNDDFECREEGCSKKMSYVVDERFWKDYINLAPKQPKGGTGR